MSGFLHPNRRLLAQQNRFSYRFGQTTLTLGLVNNMSGPAIHATTKQFHDLVMEAAGNIPLSLKIFAPFANPRHQTAQVSHSERYLEVEKLWTAKFDGMIVTGTEPKSTSLLDEPCWPFFKRLIKWSEDHVSSVIWSCLATQAAVYYLDGIERQPLTAKLSGIFDCEKYQTHPVLDGCPSHWSVPHSRYNDLPERNLLSRGYQILTRSDVAGADIFTKSTKCLHFFLQGHLEYDGDVLSREYRRDVRRFLLGETDRYPDVPSRYFSPAAAAAFDDFRKGALNTRRPGMIADFPRNADTIGVPWRQVAIAFYRNWLCCLANGMKKVDESNSPFLFDTALTFPKQSI